MKLFSLTLRIITVSALCLSATNASATANQTEINYHHCALKSDDYCGNNGADKDKKAITDIQWGEKSGKPTWSAQAGSADAKVAIDVFNTCRWIDKSDNNTESKDVFVPFQTQKEWQAFIDNYPKDFVKLTNCTRPGKVNIPPNDIGTPASDGSALCYDKAANLLTATATYNIARYERPKAIPDEPVTGISFSCYTKDGMGPLAKTVKSIDVMAYDAERKAASSPDSRDGTTSDRANNNDWGLVSVEYNYVTATCGTADKKITATKPSESELCNSGIASTVGGTGPWTWICRGLGNTASCQADKPIDGVCGSANGQSLLSAPSGSSLCSKGTASGLSGTWSWTCAGIGTGSKTAKCSAAYAPSCPGISGISCCPLSDGVLSFNADGFGSQSMKATGWDGTRWTDYGSCSYYPSWSKATLVNCIITTKVKSLPGMSNMTGACNVVQSDDDILSPVKVSLTDTNATMNSTNPMSFYLTMQDGRILDGRARGGLNPNEGWLMIHRDGGPLVFKDGKLNGDNWFGDRDKRALNGYTDLAETFKDFLEPDEVGLWYIPLHVLTKEQRSERPFVLEPNGTLKITNPSYDLRVIDASNAEHFASDYFSRVYVDHIKVSEGDGPHGVMLDNVILERSTVRTVNGANYSSVDQWVILHLKPEDKKAPKSTLLPKGSKPSS